MERLIESPIGEGEHEADDDDGRQNYPPKPRKGEESRQKAARLKLLTKAEVTPDGTGHGGT